MISPPFPFFAPRSPKPGLLLSFRRFLGFLTVFLLGLFNNLTLPPIRDVIGRVYFSSFFFHTPWSMVISLLLIIDRTSYLFLFIDLRGIGLCFLSVLGPRLSEWETLVRAGFPGLVGFFVPPLPLTLPLNRPFFRGSQMFWLWVASQRPPRFLLTTRLRPPPRGAFLFLPRGCFGGPPQRRS